MIPPWLLPYAIGAAVAAVVLAGVYLLAGPAETAGVVGLGIVAVASKSAQRSRAVTARKVDAALAPKPAKPSPLAESVRRGDDLL